ncbi:head-tail connector protein [Fangia hongkongensis]|uniref:head-tail connector protein n=1 Tax=Fangia hongkongensis TaxID=270495 RepID=UPI00035D0447|nr:head-tail connector protein [Fangia hongkongensis]
MSRAYTYKAITTPTELPISLADLKLYLRIDDNVEDALLTLMIKSVTKYIENYINRILISTQYETYRDNFLSCYNEYWELKRSILNTVDSIKYINTNNVETNVDPSIYYNTLERDYSKILLVNNKTFPSDLSRRLQAITITFTVGFGEDSASIPDDIKNVFYQLIAMLYENRGDCFNSSQINCACGQYLNATSKSILDHYRVLNI